MRYYRKFFCLLLLLCSGSTLEADGIYAFEGKHFIASYYDCDIEAVSDTKALEKVITDSVVASGATILGTNVHYFSSEGFTMDFFAFREPRKYSYVSGAQKLFCGFIHLRRSMQF